MEHVVAILLVLICLSILLMAWNYGCLKNQIEYLEHEIDESNKRYSKLEKRVESLEWKSKLENEFRLERILRELDKEA